MSRVFLAFAALLLLAGCPTPVVPPPVIPDDDDDSTAADDDDSTVADDDDSSGDDDDDDDSTEPPGLPVEIKADIPDAASLMVQDGDGAWTSLTTTDMAATFDVTDPDGRYGVLVACAGSYRSTVRVHLGDLDVASTVYIGCPEDLTRPTVQLGALTGAVNGLEGSPWSLFIGSRQWATLPASLTAYADYPEVDNYDLIAQRRDGSGLVDMQLIRRVMDAGNDPGLIIDFYDTAGEGLVHTPEDYSLDVSTPADALTNRGTFLSRGGTVQRFSVRSGAAPAWPVISNERRFDDEVFITDTTSEYAGDCTARTVAILDSLRSLDYPVFTRHQSTLVPLDPLAESECASVAAPTVSVSSGLTVDWTGAVTAGPSNTYRVELTNGDSTQRWVVSGDEERLSASLDVTAILAAVGGGHEAPAAGWAWDATAWDLADQVNGTVLHLTLDTDLFQVIPSGRARYRFERPEAARNHEYDEDDSTRPIVILPWNMEDWGARAIGRSGTL